MEKEALCEKKTICWTGWNIWLY